MPVIYRCKGCGSIIFTFERVGQDCFGVPSPSELSMRLEGRCPHCGRPLSTPRLEDVKVLGRITAPLKTYLSEPEVLTAPSQEGVLTTASVSH
ncbi:MAG: hypothetical protein DRO10_02040 [Thermoprotei archaeon]|nr:MAG: hypothetical protein DRO10_02040 [Thermoprotei archaeon]